MGRGVLEDGLDGDLREDGVGDEAFAVGAVVHVEDLLVGGEVGAAEGDSWAEDGFGDGELAVLVLFEDGDGVVLIGFDSESFAGGDGEEGEHVAAGEGSSKCVFGVRKGGVAEEFFGCRGLDLGASFKGPAVGSVVGGVGEIFFLAVPGNGDFVLGHLALEGSYFMSLTTLVASKMYGSFLRFLSHSLLRFTFVVSDSMAGKSAARLAMVSSGNSL